MEKDDAAVANGIPQRLTRLRNRAGLTRQELADRAGLTFNTINDIEKGRRPNPMEKTLQCIADALGVPYEYLASGERAAFEDLVSAQNSVGVPHRPFRFAITFATVLLLTLAVLHVRWERERPSALTTCVAKWNVSEPSAIRFEDIDGDRSIEKIQSSGNRRTWQVDKFDRTDPNAWTIVPSITRTYIDSIQIPAYGYDLNDDGWNDLMNVCVAHDGMRIEVLDPRTSQPLTEFGDISASTQSAGAFWEVDLQVVYAARDSAYNTDVAVIRANGPQVTPDGVLVCVDLKTGRELWRHTSKAELRYAQAFDLNKDQRREVVVWGSVPFGSLRNADIVGGAFAAAYDGSGRPMWRRSLSERCAEVAGCLLPGDEEGQSLVFAAVNSSRGRSEISHILLLDALTGTVVDSLSYTELIVRSPLVRRISGRAQWEVLCGTEHGAIRKYDVRDGHIRAEKEVRLDRGWVWPVAFVGGEAFGEAFVVATVDHHAFLLDRQLNVLLNRSGAQDAPISPLASFTDPEGQSYIAFACHGAEVCIDRITPDSGWRTRKWFMGGYLLILGATLLVEGRNRLGIPPSNTPKQSPRRVGGE